MALLLKDANGNLVSLANKSDKWATYNTKAAAEEALANGELAEGMLVGVMESPGVITEGSSIITTAAATLPVIASGSEVEFYSYTNTTSSDVDLYASYYNNYDASQSGYYAGFYGVLNGSTVIKTGGTNSWSSISIQVHLRPGDTVILKGKRSNSALSANVEIDISTPTLEYHTDKLYAIEPNYSTTEVNTGKKWIDGKTIYRKSYYNATNWANDAVIDTIPNVSYVVNLISVSSTNSNEIYQNYSDGSSRNDANFNTSNGKLSVRRAAVFINSYPASVIIEYTKTIE